MNIQKRYGINGRNWYSLICPPILFSLTILFLGQSCQDPIPEETLEGLTNKLVVSVPEVSGISYRSVNISGDVDNFRSNTIGAHGFCWSKTPSPNLSDSFIELSDELTRNTFSTSLSELEPNTTYYLRAYVFFGSVTIFGEEVSFTTSALETPEVQTKSFINLRLDSAIVGGEVISDGGTPVTGSGVCWSVKELPTLDDNTKSAGPRLGSFNVIIRELQPSTNYFLRAYATNEVGVSYGEQVSFETEGFVEDPDGEVYPTILLNGQTWIAKDLAYQSDSEMLYTIEGAQVACSSLGTGWRLPTLNDWKGIPTGYINLTSGDVFGDPQESCLALREGGSTGFNISAEDYWTNTAWNDQYFWVYQFYSSCDDTWPIWLIPGAISGSRHSCRCVKD